MSIQISSVHLILTNCIQTNLFSLAGKISTNEGLDIQQATYSQTAEGGAIDVFVSSEAGENIEVSGDGIVKTTLAGGNGQYFAHVPYSGTEPPDRNHLNKYWR